MGHDDETSYAMNASQSCGIAFKHFACANKSLPAGSVYVECKWSHNCSFVMLRSASYEQLQRLRASGTPVAEHLGNTLVVASGQEVVDVDRRELGILTD